MIAELGHPLVATSLHHIDELIEYPTDPQEIHEQYENLIEMMVDGGYGKILASTVIDCTDGEPKVIREGAGSVDILQ